MARDRVRSLSRAAAASSGSWIIFCIGLVVAIVAVFGRSVGFEFLSWDDNVHVTSNPYLKPPWLENLAQLWRRPYEGLYIPFSYTVFAGEKALANWLASHGVANSSAAIFHAGSVVLHASCALLVMRLLWRLTGSLIGAGCGALLFALHPLQVESVAWISETRGLLATLFSLLAVLYYISFARTLSAQRDVHRPHPILSQRERRSYEAPAIHIGWSWLRYAVATVCFGLALLSKPSAVVVPLLAGLLDVKVLKRTWKQATIALAPWLILAAADIWITGRLQPAAESGPPVALWARPLIAADALAFYLTKLVCPWGLGMHYDHAPRVVLESHWIYWSWLIPAGVLILAWLFRRTGPWLLCATLFGIALLPVLGFVPFLFQQHSTVADRYVYLAMLGPAWALALWVGTERSWRWSVAVATLCACAVLSFRQVGFWRNNQALYTHALEVNPRSYLALNNLGEDLLHRGQASAAIEYFRQALTVSPDDVNAHINLGTALAGQGQTAEAARWFQSAAKLRPSNIQAWSNLGLALAAQSQLEEAEHALERAIKLDSGNPTLHYQLGDVLRRQRRAQGAVSAYERALELRPDWPHALNDLAWLLATSNDAKTRDAARALDLAQRAAAKDPQDYATLDTLAAAEAAIGQFDAAIANAERARRLATAAGDTTYALEIENRIEKYRHRQPYFDVVP